MNNNLTAQIANVSARQINMVALERNNPIVAVTVPGVLVLVGAMWRELHALTAPQCLSFLNYYNLPPDPMNSCNNQLRKFLGGQVVER